MPRRGSFKTKDGRSYTLWADIDDVVNVLMSVHFSRTREDRRERGTMWRGHSSAQWDLIPTLHRPPADRSVIARRNAYTMRFIDGLKHDAHRLGLQHATAMQYQAIAQHYGFFTSLLDFSWNLEIAAYFATVDAQDEIGVLYSIHAPEYEKLRNPFDALGVDLQSSQRILRERGMEPLPELQLIELEQAPRIVEQEGVFIDVPPRSVATLTHETIDRFYFRQRPGHVYLGGSSHSLHVLPSRRWFASDAVYESFLEVARKEHPEVFDRTSAFGKEDLFPPIDPLSAFAEEWRKENPWEAAPPSGLLSKVRRIFSAKQNAPQVRSARSAVRRGAFADQVDRFYRSDIRSPYEDEYQRDGRRLIESLLVHAELDDPLAQRWLLWELDSEHLEHGLRLAVKVSTDKLWAREGQLGVIVADRWLERGFSQTFSHDELRESFVQVSFGAIDSRGRANAEIRKVAAVDPPLHSTQRTSPANPHAEGRASKVLSALESRLRKLDEGVVGSFLYDLHYVTMMSMGRALDVSVGIVPGAPCFQRSPLARQDHVAGPAILVRVADRFTGGVTHTSVCQQHWLCLSEGEVDILRPLPWIVLGIA